jgi:hypothetical protein
MSPAGGGVPASSRCFFARVMSSALGCAEEAVLSGGDRGRFAGGNCWRVAGCSGVSSASGVLAE